MEHNLNSILESKTASFWLKDALRSALLRDPVDAANDSDLLAAALNSRADEAQSKNLASNASTHKVGFYVDQAGEVCSTSDAKPGFQFTTIMKDSYTVVYVVAVDTGEVVEEAVLWNTLDEMEAGGVDVSKYRLAHALIQAPWQPISTAREARKNGKVILVNDTSGVGVAPWVAAKWLESQDWSGWIYDDEMLQDATPLGPRPTAWLDVPAVFSISSTSQPSNQG